MLEERLLAEAPGRIYDLIANSAFAWELKIAGWRSLQPDISEEEIKKKALLSAIENNAWNPKRHSK